MADKPHKAIILLGDGFLKDYKLGDDHSTPISISSTDAATCPALHSFACDGCSGFLALRKLPAGISENEKSTVELLQLFDLYDICEYDFNLEENTGITNVILEKTFPSISERFMSMRGMFVSNSSSASLLAEKAGFEVIPLTEFLTSHHQNPPLILPSTSSPASDSHVDSSAAAAAAATSSVLSNTAFSSLPEPTQVANKIISILGLNTNEEIDNQNPQFSGKTSDEVDVLIVHVSAFELSKNDETVRSLKDQAIHGEEKLKNDETIRSLKDRVIHGEEKRKNDSQELKFAGDAPNNTASRPSFENIAGEFSNAAGNKFDVCVLGIEWLDCIVHPLRENASKYARCQDHMHLSVMLGYDLPEAAESEKDKLEQKSPGDVALLPENILFLEKHLGFFPKQSYQLKGDKPIHDLREHHPFLVTNFLRSATLKDKARKFGVEECRKHGGNKAIFVDRFIHEIAFKVWRAPKYGA